MERNSKTKNWHKFLLMLKEKKKMKKKKEQWPKEEDSKVSVCSKKKKKKREEGPIERQKKEERTEWWQDRRWRKEAATWSLKRKGIVGYLLLPAYHSRRLYPRVHRKTWSTCKFTSSRSWNAANWCEKVTERERKRCSDERIDFFKKLVMMEKTRLICMGEFGKRDKGYTPRAMKQAKREKQEDQNRQR